MKATEKMKAARGKLIYVDESGKEVDSVEIVMHPYFMKSILRAARPSMVQHAINWAVSIEGFDEDDDPHRKERAATASKFGILARKRLVVRIFDKWQQVENWLIYGMVSAEEKIEDVPERNKMVNVLEALINSCHLMIARLAEREEITIEELNQR